MHLAPKHKRRLVELLRATPRQCVAIALHGHLVGARVDARTGDAGCEIVEDEPPAEAPTEPRFVAANK